MIQHDFIYRFANPDQCWIIRQATQRFLQALNRSEIRQSRSPIHFGQRFKFVFFDLFDNIRVDARQITGDAKGAVIHVTPGTPGDLGGFRRTQAPVELTVKLRQGRKGHMLQIQVEAHANGIGRDQMFNIAILKHFHLGIARARA